MPRRPGVAGAEGRVRVILLAALLLTAFPVARAGEDEVPVIQRYLVHLKLGDDLDEVRRIYPPAQEWPSSMDPRGRVTRYRVERAWAKTFPLKVQILHLGFKKGRLVEIQVVYDEKFSSAKTYETMAGDFSLLYGEPIRSGDRFWWADARTVLRVFPAEIPLPKDGDKAVEWRTSVQIYEKGVFERAD